VPLRDSSRLIVLGDRFSMRAIDVGPWPEKCMFAIVSRSDRVSWR
jgi:hypothetical protein